MWLDEQHRAGMLVLLRQGRSCHSIARELGGSPSTVRKVAIEAGLGLSRGRVGGVVGANEHRYRRRPRDVAGAGVEGPGVVEGPEGWLDAQGRLTLVARVLIEARLRDGRSQSRSAAELGVHRSTVSREVRKRCGGGYKALAAQRVADWCRRCNG